MMHINISADDRSGRKARSASSNLAFIIVQELTRNQINSLCSKHGHKNGYFQSNQKETCAAATYTVSICLNP